MLLVSSVSLGVVACGVSESGSLDSGGSAVSTPAALESPSVVALSYIPEALLEDLEYLQMAIDERLFADAANCQRERGWETTIDPPNESGAMTQAAFSPTQGIREAIASASDVVDPNSVKQQMSPQEQEQYSSDLNDCLVNSDWNIDFPLRSKLFNEAYDAASARVEAEPEHAAALEDSRRCMQNTGLTLPKPISIQSLNDRLAQGEEHETILEAADLIDEQYWAYQSAFEACDSKRDALARRLFNTHLNDYVEQNPHMQIAILDLEKTIERYRDTLDELKSANAD